MVPHRATPDAVARYVAAQAAVTRHITDRYGIAVEVGPVPPPLKGDLDGSRILIGDRSSGEEQLFLVAHLFGHTVQWNVSAELRRLGMTMPIDPTDRDLAVLEAYEREACRYSQQALHEAGVRLVMGRELRPQEVPSPSD